MRVFDAIKGKKQGDSCEDQQKRVKIVGFCGITGCLE
jgi:hypothetical protein